MCHLRQSDPRGTFRAAQNKGADRQVAGREESRPTYAPGRATRELSWAGVSPLVGVSTITASRNCGAMRGFGRYLMLALAAALDVAAFGLLFGLYECPGGLRTCGPGSETASALLAIILAGALVFFSLRSRRR